MAPVGTNLVLFGGSDSNFKYTNETWQWDGNDWAPVTTTLAPTARADSMMTARNGRAVLFGGVEAGGDRFDGDTWEWDGTSWTLRQAATTPPGSYYGCLGQMVTLGGKALLVTGAVGGPTVETWEFDGAWTRRAPAASPPARDYHAMAAVGSKAVLFGGKVSNTNTILGDTWEWDGSNWTAKAPAATPRPLSASRMASPGDKGVLFGGFSSGSFIDTWEWDGVTWTQRTPAHFPAARGEAAMTTRGDKVVLFGGYAGGSALDGDLWQWDGSDWTQIPFTTPWPPGRRAPALAAPQGSLVVYGGADDILVRQKDTWSWDGTRWTDVSAAGTPVYGLAVMTVLGNEAVMFNGFQTWRFSPGSAPTGAGRGRRAGTGGAGGIGGGAGAGGGAGRGGTGGTGGGAGCRRPRRTADGWRRSTDRLLRQGGADLRGERLALGVVGVGDARPEEAAQAVLAAARHDVDVQVRHALRDLVVHRDEGAVRAQAGLDGARDALDGARTACRARPAGRSDSVGDVGARDDQHVALEHRARVEEGRGVVVAQHHRRGTSPATIAQKTQPAPLTGASSRSRRQRVASARRSIAAARTLEAARRPPACGTRSAGGARRRTWPRSSRRPRRASVAVPSSTAPSCR